MIWPKWYGHLGKPTYPSRGFTLRIGPCAHDTAYQFRVEALGWHYYIVWRRGPWEEG